MPLLNNQNLNKMNLRHEVMFTIKCQKFKIEECQKLIIEEFFGYVLRNEINDYCRLRPKEKLKKSLDYRGAGLVTCLNSLTLVLVNVRK